MTDFALIADDSARIDQNVDMEGIALAREFDCPFYEASAANRINVEDAFNGLIRQVRKMENDTTYECDNLKKPKLKRFRKYVCKSDPCI